MSPASQVRSKQKVRLQKRRFCRRRTGSPVEACVRRQGARPCLQHGTAGGSGQGLGPAHHRARRACPRARPVPVRWPGLDKSTNEGTNARLTSAARRAGSSVADKGGGSSANPRGLESRPGRLPGRGTCTSRGHRQRPAPPRRACTRPAPGRPAGPQACCPLRPRPLGGAPLSPLAPSLRVPHAYPAIPLPAQDARASYLRTAEGGGREG